MGHKLICWSGGLDSTALLIDKLQNTEDEIRTLSYFSPCFPGYKQEQEARKKIKKQLKKMGYDFKSVEINCELPNNLSRGLGDGYIQQPFWISTTPCYLKQDEDLLLGFIQEDGIFYYKTEMYAIFNNLQKIMQKNGKLLFPYSQTAKFNIYKWMKENYNDILKNVWYCEDFPNLTNVPCKKCNFCKRWKRLKYEYKQNNS